MALPIDPPVYDRLDQHDYDGDPGRLVPHPDRTSSCPSASGCCGSAFEELSTDHAMIRYLSLESDYSPLKIEISPHLVTDFTNGENFGVRRGKFRTPASRAASLRDTKPFPDTGRLPIPQQVGQGPEYVVKLLERPSKLDEPCFQAHTQPTPFVNHFAQQIAESTAIYDHHCNHLYQQFSTSETELSEMSVATISVDRHENDLTQAGSDVLPTTTMAAPTKGWPAEGRPVCAAPDDLMDPMFTQPSPLSDLYEAPDEMDDWAMLINHDMLATGDFTNMGCTYPTETDYAQAMPSPEDIFNDPAVQFDVEQSLFSFNAPLPDLSASDYLSGTDQFSVSSYFGSASTSPYEASLDFLPDASMPLFPPANSISTSPFVGTTSPTSSDADYPYRCTTDNCTKTFRKEAQLKQHQRVHRKSLVCTICRAEHRTEHKFAQVRDLERHLQARHPEVAQSANVRSEIRECPHPGCDHRGRRDNVSRHHESKHGKKLKWKRSVPHVVD
ncbi:hypothetical protein CkaCkLH20_12262 [Colletotrichum karsti]|uniref:C2H2-type domain-containing protein n=1 Tax=Colletotrichum karsti TaxID=1095194 RepID=A0A9P6HWF0_9PEZI|nr:uncharacterized protein CkaCkLH20_12262 [Colletotrichum karsti]KAF9870176.1 hypothetical protein CkaCkLH20_12262 [Colletotrichum karsti]